MKILSKKLQEGNWIYHGKYTMLITYRNDDCLDFWFPRDDTRAYLTQGGELLMMVVDDEDSDTN